MNNSIDCKQNIKKIYCNLTKLMQSSYCSWSFKSLIILLNYNWVPVFRSFVSKIREKEHMNWNVKLILLKFDFNIFI